MPRPSSLSWLTLIVRLALGIHVVAGGLAALAGGIPTTDPAAWIPAHAGARAIGYAVLLVIAGLATALGVQTRRAATVVAAVLVVLVFEWLAVDPLYNTMNHLVPLLAEAAVVILLAERAAPLGVDALWRPFPPDDDVAPSTVVALARVFLGSIFVAQGWSTLFGDGLIAFAREVYVTPLADSWVPAPLLWVAGVLNPPLQLAGGLLFITGLFTRTTAVVLGLFLCSILFGHVLGDPFDRGPDVHSYAFANLALVLLSLGLSARGNRYSLDAVIARARARR